MRLFDTLVELNRDNDAIAIGLAWAVGIGCSILFGGLAVVVVLLVAKLVGL